MTSRRGHGRLITVNLVHYINLRNGLKKLILSNHQTPLQSCLLHTIHTNSPLLVLYHPSRRAMMLAMLGTRLATLPRTLQDIPMEEAVLEIMGTIYPRNDRVTLSRNMLGQWDTGQPTRTRTKRSVLLDYLVIEYVAYFILHNSHWEIK